MVVWAENADHAVLLAEYHMEEAMRELFSDEYNDDYDEENERGMYDDESAVTVNSIEVFDENHECWKFFCDPSQAEFYPVIGDPQ